MKSQPFNKTIILINAGSIKKRSILQKLKKLGLTVIVVDKEPNWAKPYVDDWILVDTGNHDLTLRAIGDYLKTRPVNGVLTFWENNVLLTTKVVEKYKFIGIPYKVAKTARNKYLFREFCSQHGLPFPKYCLLNNDAGLKTTRQSLQYPLVVKPVYGSSSAYVVKVENSDELKEVYRYLKTNLSPDVEPALQDGLGIMAEEYIDGDEVDIDILVQNGKIKFYSITDNWQTQEPFFVETGEAIPSTLPQRAKLELISLAETTLEKMGVMNGCIHYEAKYGKAGPVPIEVNLRLGGDKVYSFVKGAWKVDLIENAVKIACGEYINTITNPSQPYHYLAGKYFLPDKSGVLSSLHLPRRFPKKFQVQEFYFFKQVGDTTLTPPSGYEFLGWLTVAGDNPNNARDNLETAMNQVSYNIVPFSDISAIGKTQRNSPFKAAFIKSNLLKGRTRIEKIRLVDLKNQRKLIVGIACNTFEGVNGAVEAELTSVGKNIQDALEERGYRSVFIDFNDLEQTADCLKNGQVDLVFNVGERINNSSLLEPHIAAFLDVYQIPYTGSSPFTLALSMDKIRVKKLLTYHNIPTPRWDYAYDLDDEIREDLRFPLIVKPGNTDNSIGISNNSVAVNRAGLKKQLEYVLKGLNRPALVEEYLEGDEYDVSIMGSEEDDLTVLPLSRTIFDKLPAGYWHIYPFESKFSDMKIYKKYLIIQKPPKNVNKKLISLITEIALDTYNILDCHDYGRVEIKLDKNNNPHVLELNPNPSINKDDCVSQVARLIGMDYGDFLERIIALAIKRYKDRPPYYHLQTGLI